MVFTEILWFFLEWFAIIVVTTKILSKLTMGWCKSNTCLVGKTVIVTGGNSGLGYQTALILAGRGAKVIIADVNDSTVSRNAIIKATKNPKVTSKHLDLSSFDSIRKFSDEIHKEEDKLDILINNAGIGGAPYSFTGDGLHTQMQVNYFGPFLLTHLLVDLLKRAAPSRIVFVSSFACFAHRLSSLEFVEKPTDYKNDFTHAVAYSNSKLCALIASNAFAEKLHEFNVTSNAVHPGCVDTPIFVDTLGKDYRRYTKLFMRFLLKVGGKTPYEGAQTQANCALSKSLEHVTGKFFVDCRPFFQPSKTKEQEFCKRLWELSERLVKLKPEEKLV